MNTDVTAHLIQLGIPWIGVQAPQQSKFED